MDNCLGDTYVDKLVKKLKIYYNLSNVIKVK